MVSTGNRRRVALQGKLRQRGKNGQFHYRLYVSDGVRKEFALKTSDPDEAVNKAFDLDSLWLAPTAEVAFAQMKAIRGFSKMARRITLEDGWGIYQTHPDRAIPHSHNEQREYHTTYWEFVRVASEGKTVDGTRRIPVIYIREFKDPANPLRVVFVCAMWLTGFDVKCLSCSTADFLPGACRDESSGRPVAGVPH